MCACVFTVFGKVFEVVSRSPPLKAGASVFVSDSEGLKFTFDIYRSFWRQLKFFLKAVPQLDGFKRCSYGRDFGVDGDSGIC